MDDARRRWDESKRIIRSACEALAMARDRRPVFARHWCQQSGDSFVLLQDATRMFCEAVSACYGEDPARRWDPALPEWLLNHPERCEETLARLESAAFLERAVALAEA